MNLEYLSDVVIQKEKILDYLLNAQHEEGAGKAEFFLGLGFARESWEAFADALQALARQNSVAKQLETRHGLKYVVEGRLAAPNGAAPYVRTVWIADAGQATARLVTAYPLAEDRR